MKAFVGCITFWSFDDFGWFALLATAFNRDTPIELRFSLELFELVTLLTALVTSDDGGVDGSG